MDKLLENHAVIITVGTGGVGKTTVSASLGVKSAEKGYKTLVLTIDPARRLKSALGLEQLNETTKIEGEWSGELYASMIDFKNVFDGFVKKMSPSPKVTERILKNSLYLQLSTSLGGTQNYTSLERLHEAVLQEKFDRVILDTPPAQHAQDFLTAPRKIYALFEGSIFKWFMTDKAEKKGFVEKIVNRGTQTVLKQLENLTGGAFVSELGDFFNSVADLRESVQSHSGEIHDLLSSKKTTFLLVTGFDKTKLAEAENFLADLKKGGYHLGGVVINRVFPQINFEDLSAESKKVLPPDILSLYEKMKSYFGHNIQASEDFQNKLGKGVAVTEIPDLPNEITSVKGLKEMSAKL